MTLALHPDVLPAAYEFLRTTPPFRSWKLPEADEIAFKVSRHKSRYGEYCCDGGRHSIEISQEMVGHTETLLATMAHEMIHLRQVMTGKDPSHNGQFDKMRGLVAKHHGFDPKCL